MAKRKADWDESVLLVESSTDSESIWNSSEESCSAFSMLNSDDDVEENVDSDPITGPPDTSWIFKGEPRLPFTFTENSGIQIPDLTKDKINEIFENFFTDELIDIIVTETNRYASMYLKTNIAAQKPNSRSKDWIDTDLYEIRTILGLFLIQGINSKPENKLYFSRRESIETPFFIKVITERRFSLLQKFIRFCNNEESDPISLNRELCKIQPILDYLRKKFLSVYIPEKDLYIEKSFLERKARNSNLSSKKKKTGMKMFALRESATGYIYNFFIYTGRNMIYNDQLYNSEPLSSRIVFELIHPLLGKGHCLYIDNHFTSMDLIEKLGQQQTDCVGTLKSNSTDIPNIMKTIKLNKGDHVAMYRNKQIILKWQDRRDVFIASSIHDDSKQPVKVNRNTLIEKPVALLDYNANIGGCDFSDSHLNFYTHSKGRTKTYYMQIFKHFLDLTTLNCFKIYKKLGGKNNQFNFILTLAEEIIETYAERRDVNLRRSKTPKPSRFIERHFPSIIPPTTKLSPTKRCVLCSKSGVRKESRYWCEDCKTGLCVAPCFMLYHTKE